MKTEVKSEIEIEREASGKSIAVFLNDEFNIAREKGDEKRASLLWGEMWNLAHCAIYSDGSFICDGEFDWGLFPFQEEEEEEEC